MKTDISYLKDVSPPPVLHDSKTNVTIDITILSILEISEVDFQISLQMEMSLTWLDKRLTMIDLHRETDLNTLTKEFTQKIWLPQVIFL